MKRIESYELEEELLSAINELKKNAEQLHIYNFSTNTDILTIGDYNRTIRLFVEGGFNITEVLEMLVKSGYICIYRFVENKDVISLYLFWKPNFLMESLIEKGYEKFELITNS